MFIVFLLVKAALIFITATALVYYLLCIYSANSFFGESEPSNVDFFPPISVLIPVRGIDHLADQNFESFSRQNYPQFEILFGIEEPEDPVGGIIRELKTKFSDRDIRLIECRQNFGPNAKVSNLITLLKHARYELVLMVDSDIRVGPDYLRRIVAPLASPEVGLVTCPYRGIEARTLAAKLEAVGISSDFIPGVLVARRLEGVRFGLGATLLTRKAVLAAIGGLGQMADYLGDDFLLGKLVARYGFRVVLSRYIVDNVQAPDSILAVLRHQVRWARSTKYSRPLGYTGLILTQGVAASLAILVSLHATLPEALLAISTLAMRFLVAIRLGVIGLGDRSLWRNIWLVPVRDLINLGVWCFSFLGDTIVWRGRKFRLEAGGRLVPIGERATAVAPAHEAARQSEIS